MEFPAWTYLVQLLLGCKMLSIAGAMEDFPKGIPGEEIYVCQPHSGLTEGIYGNNVTMRAEGAERGVWIDHNSKLGGGRVLRDFYVYIDSGDWVMEQTQPESHPVYLQIWRSSFMENTFTLMWERKLMVQYPTPHGLLYKVRVGNTNDASSVPYMTTADDRLGFTNMSPQRLVAASSAADDTARSYNLQLQDNSRPAVGENYTFEAVNKTFSLAVKLIEDPQTFENRTLTTDGCGCEFGKTSKNDCACCVAGSDTCQCPGVTSPASCTFCSAIETCPSDYVCDIITVDGCYQIQHAWLNYNEAEQFCRMIGGEFGDVCNPSLTSISEEAEISGWPMVWTGIHVPYYDWVWVLNYRVEFLEYQGCFHIGSPLSSLLSFNKGVTTSAEGCVQACEDDSYNYAAINTINANLECYCGDVFDSAEAWETTPDTCKCVDDQTKFCGATDAQAVFVVGGQTYSKFSDSEVLAGTHCAALNTSVPGWVKVNCLERVNFGYICEYAEIDREQCTAVTNNIYVANRCLSLHTNDYNWYEAAKSCQYQHGHLVKITNENMDTEIITLASQIQPLWWIGLTNRVLMFTGTRVPVQAELSNFDFQNGQPNLSHDCVAMVQGYSTPSNYSWVTSDCKTQANFLCQLDHNNCSPDTCVNGGTCRDELNDFQCRCTDGWQGKRCQERDDDNNGGNNPPDDNQSPNPSISTTTDDPKDGDGDGGGGDGDLATLGTAVGVVAGVIVVATVVIVMLCLRSRKMKKELESLSSKESVRPDATSGAVNSGFIRQESVYDRIEDHYHTLDNHTNDTNSSHYYKGMVENYQGLADDTRTTPTPTNGPYQGLNAATQYQLLANGTSEATNPYQPVNHYQGLQRDEPQYQGLEGVKSPDSGNSVTQAEYADARTSVNEDINKNNSNATKSNPEPPDLPYRPNGIVFGSSNIETMADKISSAGNIVPSSTPEYIDVVGPDHVTYSYTDDVGTSKNLDLVTAL